MKKINHSTIIAAICFCVLLVFSVIVFPFILAASPENREIETIEPEDFMPVEESAQTDENAHFDENMQLEELFPELHQSQAISKEQAIEIAMKSHHPVHGPPAYYPPVHEDSCNRGCEAVDVIYVESSNPQNAPSWYVLILERTWGESFIEVPDGYSPEEWLEIIAEHTITYQDHATDQTMPLDCFHNSPGNDNGYSYPVCSHLSIGVNDDGTPVVVKTYHDIYYMVSVINAFTGEWICERFILMFGTSFSDFSNIDELKEHIIDWELLP